MATIIIAVLATAVVAAVVTYLFLRANPNKRAKLDKAVEKAKAKLAEFDKLNKLD